MMGFLAHRVQSLAFWLLQLGAPLHCNLRRCGYRLGQENYNDHRPQCLATNWIHGPQCTLNMCKAQAGFAEGTSPQIHLCCKKLWNNHQLERFPLQNWKEP